MSKKRALTNDFELIDRLMGYSDKQLLRSLKIPQTPQFAYRPLKLMSLRNKIRYNDEYGQNFNTNLTSTFIRELLHYAKFSINLMLCIFCFHQRSGKSGLGISIARWYSKLLRYDLWTKDIYPSQLAWLQDVPNRPFNSVGVMDEVHNLKAQIGANVAEEELGDMQRIIAKELLHSIYITATIDYDTTAHYGIEPIAFDYKHSLTKALLYDLDKSDTGFNVLLGYIVFPHYDTTINKINHFELETMPKNKLTDAQKFRVAYEEKKNAWNKEIKTRGIGERSKERLILADKLANIPVFQEAKNMAERKAIARFNLPAGFAEDEVNEICTLAKDRSLLDQIMAQIGIKPHLKVRKELNPKEIVQTKLLPDEPLLPDDEPLNDEPLPPNDEPLLPDNQPLLPDNQPSLPDNQSSLPDDEDFDE
jgi:hypothetical protein